MHEIREALIAELMRGAQPDQLKQVVEDLNPDELKKLFVAADVLQKQVSEIEGSEECPECGGEGKGEEGEDCPMCGGSGMTTGKGEEEDGYDQPGSMDKAMKGGMMGKGQKLGKMKNMILLISAKKKAATKED